jgi:hypothetical protein
MVESPFDEFNSLVSIYLALHSSSKFYRQGIEIVNNFAILMVSNSGSNCVGL